MTSFRVEIQGNDPTVHLALWEILFRWRAGGGEQHGDDADQDRQGEVE